MRGPSPADPASGSGIFPAARPSAGTPESRDGAAADTGVGVAPEPAAPGVRMGIFVSLPLVVSEVMGAPVLMAMRMILVPPPLILLPLKLLLGQRRATGHPIVGAVVSGRRSSTPAGVAPFMGATPGRGRR